MPGSNRAEVVAVQAATVLGATLRAAAAVVNIAAPDLSRIASWMTYAAGREVVLCTAPEMRTLCSLFAAQDVIVIARNDCGSVATGSAVGGDG
jgi:hypothetical protein